MCGRSISIAIPRFGVRFVCGTVLEYFNRGDLGLHVQYLLPVRGQDSERGDHDLGDRIEVIEQWY